MNPLTLIDESPTIESSGFSAKGIRRETNQDNFLEDPENNLFILADGMGGLRDGEVASQIAVSVLAEEVPANLTELSAPETLRGAFVRAREQIAQVASNGTMGASVVVFLIGECHSYVANLGDSRAYLIRDGEINQLTVDHSIAAALVENGALTPELAQTSHWKHTLWKYVGGGEDDGTPDIHEVAVQSGDYLILMSDGVSNVLSDQMLLELVTDAEDVRSAARLLVEKSKELESTDDSTCIVVAIA